VVNWGPKSVNNAEPADVGKRVSRGAGGGSAQRSPHASGARTRACCRCLLALASDLEVVVKRGLSQSPPYKCAACVARHKKRQRCTHEKHRDRQHNRRLCSCAAASSVVWPSTRRRASASPTSRPSNGRPLVPRFDPRTSTQPADRSDTPLA
jgi:hypothetical protein